MMAMQRLFSVSGWLYGMPKPAQISSNWRCWVLYDLTVLVVRAYWQTPSISAWPAACQTCGCGQ